MSKSILSQQNEIYFNKLYARVDWLEFTVTDYRSELSVIDNVAYYLEFVGLPFDLFNPTGKGGMGYRSTMRHVYENIFVFYDGSSEDMGIHIRISGSSVSYVLNSLILGSKCDTPFGVGYDIGNECDIENVLPLFIKRVLDIGHFTRIDLAIDDVGAQYFKVNDVYNLVNAGCVVSKFKKWQNVKGNSFTSECFGHTLYMGSRESDVFLRIYEKGLEQDIPIDWIRWELEIKHKKADVVALQLLENKNFGSVAMGILKSYVHIVNLDNVRRTRCSENETWSAFVSDVETLRLTLPEKEKSYEDKINWIEKQCLPTLAGIIYAKGGDMSFISDNLETGFDRLCAKDKALYRKVLESDIYDNK